MSVTTGFTEARGGIADFLRGLYDDALIMRTLTLRELRGKYKGNPLGFLLELLKPAILCTVHYFYFAYMARDVPNHVYLVFVAGGFSTWLCFIKTYMATLHSASGTAMSIPGVTPMHASLATATWSFLIFFTFSYALSVPAWLLGAPISPPNFVLSVQTYGMASFLGLAFGLNTGAIGTVLPVLAPFLKMFRWAMFITSGIYNSLSTMPKIEMSYVRYNPIINLAEYQRHSFDAGYPVFFASMSYPAEVLAVLMLTGLAANRALARRGRGMNGYFA
jgi:ABC-type polysaccharide/polyol phosphate export permease